jgi:hypothetical protein
MTRRSLTLSDAIAGSLQLPPIDRVRLIERLVSSLEGDVARSARLPHRSLYGLFADLGTAPSSVDIDHARNERWAGFPREDI